jgi:thiamine kinase-like enzyme
VQKEAYIVQNEHHKLFVKFDVATPTLPRLAALGVAPPLLFTGTHKGRPYIIQSLVEGTHPDRGWFAQHVVLLASFIKRYHGDKQLTDLLSALHSQSYEEHIQSEVAALEHALTTATLDMFATPQTRSAIDCFTQQSTRLSPLPLVPVHADPSPVNILVTQQGLLMVDWDDVLLSDPMRDMGLVLWWYLPRRLWQPFVDAYGTPLDQDRLFWWVAKRLLELALWLDQRQAHTQAQAFLEDFLRAVQHQDNPQVTA